MFLHLEISHATAIHRRISWLKGIKYVIFLCYIQNLKKLFTFVRLLQVHSSQSFSSLKTIVQENINMILINLFAVNKWILGTFEVLPSRDNTYLLFQIYEKIIKIVFFFFFIRGEN